MTVTFLTDGNNDLQMNTGTLRIVSGLEAVLLICRHCALAILGEMIFAKQNGMPYFETVWNGSPATAPFEAAFRARIAQIDGVESIEELVTEQVGDRMQYSALIRTIYGTGTLNG